MVDSSEWLQSGDDNLMAVLVGRWISTMGRNQAADDDHDHLCAKGIDADGGKQKPSKLAPTTVIKAGMGDDGGSPNYLQ